MLSSSSKLVFSLKILQITTLLSCLQNTAQLILFSMTTYRFEVALIVKLALKRILCCSWFHCLLLFQGTASVVLAGVVAALKLVGGALAEQKFLFLGAGEVRLFLGLFPSWLHIGFSSSLYVCVCVCGRVHTPIPIILHYYSSYLFSSLAFVF